MIFMSFWSSKSYSIMTWLSAPTNILCSKIYFVIYPLQLLISVGMGFFFSTSFSFNIFVSSYPRSALFMYHIVGTCFFFFFKPSLTTSAFQFWCVDYLNLMKLLICLGLNQSCCFLFDPSVLFPPFPLFLPPLGVSENILWFYSISFLGLLTIILFCYFSTCFKVYSIHLYLNAVF